MSADLRRPNDFTIDLQVIADNVRAIRSRIGRHTHFIATLKADAYGFGLLPVARTVLAAGADALSVVRMEDAVALRDDGIACPIVLYAGNVLTPQHVRVVEDYDLIPTVHDRHSLDVLARASTRRIGCALKVNCGQERIGVAAEDVGDFVSGLAASAKLRLDILNTHPHVVEGNDAYLRWQFERFASACEAAQAHCGHRPLRIFASSRVLAQRGDMLLSGVDPGQALFRLPDGLAPPGAEGRTPFLRLASRLIHVFTVRRGGFADECPVPSHEGARVGIVPIGYGDGLNGCNAGEVLVRGQRARIAAAPSVEYTRIDLSRCPLAEVGDEVVFVGRQGDDWLRPEDAMRHSRVARVTDMAMQVGRSIPRHYLQPRPDGVAAPLQRMEPVP